MFVVSGASSTTFCSRTYFPGLGHWLTGFVFICSLLLLFPPVALASPHVDLVRVLKSERKLQLIAKGRVLEEFSVSLGANPIGHKRQKGDKRTPEGRYHLDFKKNNSAFYKAIHISYPNKRDIRNARRAGVSPGGQIMIHGQKNGYDWAASYSTLLDWTNGCIALSNSDMDVVWRRVRVGTPIELLP